MIQSLMRLKHALILILFALSSNSVLGQLPQCDRIYLDQYDFNTFGSTQKIYNYNPAAPVSATNPALNSIQLPSSLANGLTVGEVLGSGNTTLTFYTVVNDVYWYYNPTTSTWVNTGHSTGSSGMAVNIASGGGYIYNLAGNNGEVYQYDGTGNGTLLVTINDFQGEGPYDLIADCAGNFYLLNATGNFATPFLRKYNSSGVLVQSWTINNPNGYSPSGGFGIFGTQIFMDNIDMTTFAFGGIVNGAINTTSADLLNTTAPFAAYSGFVCGDLGSCASGVPVLPDITITATSPTTVAAGSSVSFSSTINAGGSAPGYQWMVNGVPFSGATSSTFTYVPNAGDIVSCVLTSSLTCISAPTGLSNTIAITVDNCESPKLNYSPSELCSGNITLTPVFSPAGGSFSASPSGLNINSSTGVVNLNASNIGSYIITYTKQANTVCPATSTRDTITIFPPPAVKIKMSDFGVKFCINEEVTLQTTPGTGYAYEWFPAMYLADNQKNNGPSVLAKAVSTGFVKLSVTTSQGCTTTDSIALNPEPCCVIMVPNAFSPNGDGLNDIFKINSVAEQTLNQFSIYNRLGQRVYSGHALNDGWDGTFHDKPADVGVYYYYITYTCANGKQTVEKGEVALIR